MYMITVGIDEVGRGSLAGPLVAGAVILRRPIKGLKDSKLLTRQQREKLAIIIHKRAIAVGLGWVEPKEIDAIGLTASVRRAMTLALEQVTEAYDEIIIDGNFNFLAKNPRARVCIKADQTVPQVSAASIIAKVARDQFMREIASTYPEYGFETHVGYGTDAHRTALRKYGICGIHRRSYKPVQEYMLIRNL